MSPVAALALAGSGSAAAAFTADGNGLHNPSRSNLILCSRAFCCCMQVEHQAPVAALALAGSGSAAAAVTADGALGVMDLRAESYTTLMHSHSGPIVGLAVHPSRCVRQSGH